ncbi:MAG: NAD(P)H-dependent oxidoreductase [Propionibacteriaceae bacterium]|jgi:NAD(P)H-dependent FMN reductase|nr:NAD(P)H-dependent oxidoreductase [Propionibacteriaceae bacterium]
MRITIINGSMTPKHYGNPIAEWIAEEVSAVNADDVETDVVHLCDLNLPFYDEPELPRLKNYEHEHSWRWSERVDAADAFIFVSPEYNHSYSAVLKNALDYLYLEWNHKPAAIVSYGSGVSAGREGAQHLRSVLATLKMLPIQEGVSIPFVDQFTFTDRHGPNGVFMPDEPMVEAAQAMIRELIRLRDFLSVFREASHSQRQMAEMSQL